MEALADLAPKTALVLREGVELEVAVEDLLRITFDPVKREKALTERPRTNEANEALARHLWVHAEQWFQFLMDPSIPATNYRAEQALRPAVVNRKVWGGNRTEAGAEAQGVLSSVLQTCRQQVVAGFEYVRDTLCHGFASLFKSAPEVGR